MKRKSEIVSQLENSFWIASSVVRKLGALPKNCHWLPLAAIWERQNRYARFFPFNPPLTLEGVSASSGDGRLKMRSCDPARRAGTASVLPTIITGQFWRGPKKWPSGKKDGSKRIMLDWAGERCLEISGGLRGRHGGVRPCAPMEFCRARCGHQPRTADVVRIFGRSFDRPIRRTSMEGRRRWTVKSVRLPNRGESRGMLRAWNGGWPRSATWPPARPLFLRSTLHAIPPRESSARIRATSAFV